jgi:1,4-dihydroxy-2-naphthoate octaprenyltransferase
LDKHGLRVWYEALRVFSYPASIVPVLVGAVVAWQNVRVDLTLFLLSLFGSVAIQVGTNLANEYLDYVQGIDKMDSLGPAGVILRGELPPRRVFYAAVFAFGVGSVIGFYLAYRAGWFILLIGVVSVLAAWFYTAKPFALGYSGLGELEVFIFMGPVIVIGSYYVQTKSLSCTPLLVSLPIGLLVMAILHANNLRDVVQDDQRERVTWVVLAHRWLSKKNGKNLSIWIYCMLILGSYLIILLLAGFGMVPLFALLTILTAPQAFSLIKFVRSGVEGKPLNRAVRGTARLHMMFGATLALGYALEILLYQR